MKSDYEILELRRRSVLVPGDDPARPTQSWPASGPTFEILEHPADIGFRAFGRTLAELFETAALALLSIACEIEDIMPQDEHHVEASGTDYESLLVAWLNEVLYWFDGKRIAFRQFRVQEIEPERVTAVVWGEPRAAIRHRAKVIVKAVTWHQLRVSRSSHGWVAEVYLDV
jgi:SHS2 domain-containing protein